MLLRRVIPCLDVDKGRVVKGVEFVNLRDAGDPVELAVRYQEEGADDVCLRQRIPPSLLLCGHGSARPPQFRAGDDQQYRVWRGSAQWFRPRGAAPLPDR